MICFMYAGQGSQRVGMGADFYADDAGVRRLYDAFPADRDRSFHGPQAALNETAATQPAMGLFAAAVTDYLAARGIRPDLTMGLSWGVQRLIRGRQFYRPATGHPAQPTGAGHGRRCPAKSRCDGGCFRC